MRSRPATGPSASVRCFNELVRPRPRALVHCLSLQATIDLHMHSSESDGILPVAELVRRVHAANISAFAITDHDTVSGLAEAHDVAESLGLRHVTGVEISTRWDTAELHILGYGFDPTHPALFEPLARQRVTRFQRVEAIVETLRQLGLDITVAQVLAVAGEAVPGRPHLARALVLHGHARNVDDAFRHFLSDGSRAFVRRPMPEPRDAIQWIHAAGGRAVWAHPAVRPVQCRGGIDNLARRLKGWGLDGLEEAHPAQHPGARRRIRRIARELDLLLTGGSDFHGASSTAYGALGSNGPDEHTVDRLLAR